MINLRLNVLDTEKHPETVMRELGIAYGKAIPQTISDTWLFVDCANVPTELPKCLIRIDP